MQNKISLEERVISLVKEEADYWNIEYEPEEITLELNLYQFGFDENDIYTICEELMDIFDSQKSLDEMNSLNTIQDIIDLFQPTV